MSSSAEKSIFSPLSVAEETQTVINLSDGTRTIESR